MKLSIFLAFLFFLLFQSNANASGIHTIHNKNNKNISWGSIYRKVFNKEEFNKSYALVIGISDYTSLKSLEAPEVDAIRVRNFLLNTAGFDYVITLTNERATREVIDKLMIDYFPSQLKSNDRFLFYFSGHGLQRNTGKNLLMGYLALRNSEKSTYSSMISMSDIKRWSDLLGKSKQALFILDACFSGLAGTQNKSPLSNKSIQRLSKYAHHLITAGTSNEVSIASMSKWGGSLFTSAFLAGASGNADTRTSTFQEDGLVSIKELMEYIGRRIDKELDTINREKLVKQYTMTPQLSDLQFDNEGEFFFISGSQHDFDKNELVNGFDYIETYGADMPIIMEEPVKNPEFIQNFSNLHDNEVKNPSLIFN